MQETWIQSLGQEDALEKKLATHSSIFFLGNPTDKGARWARGRVGHNLVTQQQQHHHKQLSI